MSINAVQAGIQAQGLRKTAPVKQAPAPEQASQPERKQPASAFDEYVPEDKDAHAPIGLYRVVQEDGVPKVEFDDPEKPAPSAPKAPDGEKKEANTTTMDTGKVDREIKALKEKREKLSQQAEREQNPQRKEELERQLAQVEQELAQKDNDTYRKNHAVVS